MARKKVLQRQRGGHSASNMLKALRMHRAGESSRKAAKAFNIAYPTLRRYVAQNLNVADEDLSDKRLIPNYENHLIFTAEQEEIYKTYVKECALKLYGLTSKDCRKVAYEMAKINNIKIPDSWERDKIAGKEWFRSFRKRHGDISIQKPEACSLARATSFNRETVKSFFDNLKTAMARHPSFSNGCRLYNLDETATTTVQRPQKMVGPKGKHNIAKVTSGEKGILVTTCAIICASGQALPPAFVFPRKNFKDIMLRGAPPGSLGLAHLSGWMTSDLFVEVMKHFIKHASPENPALLILDNHESHLSIEALDIAKSAGVTVLTLYPHTTAKMQPLDVGLNGPFKVFYNNAIDSWIVRHPGQSMTIYTVAECVGTAHARAMTPVNISAAFKKCGIFPFDPDVFTDIDFLPSDVTDRPLPSNVADRPLPSNVADRPLPSNVMDRPLPSNVIDRILPSDRMELECQGPDLVPDLDSENVEIQSLSIKSDNTFCEDLPESPSLLDTANEDEASILDLLNYETVDLSMTTTSKLLPRNVHSSPVAGLSQNVSFVSPQQFMPPLWFMLKAGPRNERRKSRKRGKSRIVTDTPEKLELIEDKKKHRENKVKVKVVKRTVLKDIKEKKNVPKKIVKKKKGKKIDLNESTSEEEFK